MGFPGIAHCNGCCLWWTCHGEKEKPFDVVVGVWRILSRGPTLKKEVILAFVLMMCMFVDLKGAFYAINEMCWMKRKRGSRRVYVASVEQEV